MVTAYAIIGDGATGSTAAYHVRQADPTGRITIYCDDPTPAYYRAALTNYLVGELRAEQLFAVPPNFYDRWRIERVLTRVDGIDTGAQLLDLSTGRSAAYDQLLIAAGARARKPDFPGSDLEGVMPMRTMQDGRSCIDMISSGDLRKAVIVGGGILGIEWVAGLRSRGVDVTFVIREPQFWQGIVDKAASDLVISRCRHFGVDVRLEEELGEVYGRKGHFVGVKLKNSGDEVEAQLLGLAVGIIPNVEFLAGSNVEVDKGIPVDAHMRSNIKNVYAGGDIAQVMDPYKGRSYVMGLWEPARHHGRVAGINMAGGDATWEMDVTYNATRLYDLDLAAIGEVMEQPSDDVVIDFPQEGGRISYSKLIIREGKLIGALLLGQRREKTRARGRLLHQVVKLGVDVAAVRDSLLDPFFDIHGWVGAIGQASRSSSRIPAMLGRTKPDMGGEFRPSTTAAATLGVLMGPRAASAPVVGPPVQGGIGSPSTRPATVKLADGSLKEVDAHFTIGSGNGNDLVVADATVDETHTWIERVGDIFVITDGRSTGITFVNNSPIIVPRELRDGDVIRVGSSELRFMQASAAPRAETGPAGLPDEPLGALATSDDRVLGHVTVGGQIYPIGLRETDIGQDPRSEIVVLDPSTSFQHAQISRQDRTLYLRDLGSRFGTYVNNKLLTVPHMLSDQDVIRIGDSELRFTVAPPAPVAAGPSAPKTATGRGLAADEVSGAGESPSVPAATPMTTTVPAATSPTSGEEREVFVQPPGEHLAPASADPTYFSPVPTEMLPTPEMGIIDPVPGARLRGIAGSVAGVSFALRGPRVTIGSNESCEIRLTEPSINAKQAELEARPGDWTITHHGESPTILNGSPLPMGIMAVLAPGDEIQAGSAVFVYEVVPLGQGS